ncbi:PLP-dependent aminotransferase family protein [Phyllobacterium phragmitis]|uniref:PLP-dependent aminotransferase family protein n=1 Tax=Phyllobacterium phragmitis TaxID=2670329 RepID=A0ABQ0GZE9_9HYPH
MGDSAAPRWAVNIRDRTGPIYLRIVDALAEARAAGTLHPGDRLPAQRDLAQLLGIDLTTVTRAFSEARRRNLIDAAPGRGSFVTSGGAEEPILDLGMIIPPSPAGMNLPSLIRSGIDGLLRRSSAETLLSYHPDPGSPAERAAGTEWLGEGGDRLPVERIAVGPGAQSLLCAVLMTLSRPDDAVLADSLTYPGFISLARTLQRRIVGVAGDEEGMRPDVLDALAGTTGARLVYLNPTLHNPTTLTMPARRRRELIDVARRRNLLIIEDDPYTRLLPSGEPTFLALAPDLTFHVATLAKCISPFLRTAFLAAPDGESIGAVAQRLRSIALMAPPLMTGLAAEWIRSGTAAEIARGIRREMEARQALAAGILPAQAQGQPCGLHVWLPLQQDQRAATIVDAARRRGLAVSAGSDFAVSDDAPDGIRIALGAIATRSRLEEALRSFAATLQAPIMPTTVLV